MPYHLILVIEEDDLLRQGGIQRLRAFVRWCRDIGVGRVTVYADTMDVGPGGEVLGERLTRLLREGLMGTADNLHIYTRDSAEPPINQEGGFVLEVSLGYGGRRELTTAVRQVIQRVEKGEIMPYDIDEAVIGEHLLFKVEPDLVIRASGRRLTDFLLWQTVYSELYFTDVNWHQFRKIDLLRAIRDYQRRQRRFGT